MTRLLNTPIIGPSAKTVASSWIDMLAGLSALYILRMPPAFCAKAALPAQNDSNSGVTAANRRRCRVMRRTSTVRAGVRRISDARGGALSLPGSGPGLRLRAPAGRGRLKLAIYRPYKKAGKADRMLIPRMRIAIRRWNLRVFVVPTAGASRDEKRVLIRQKRPSPAGKTAGGMVKCSGHGQKSHPEAAEISRAPP